MHHYKKILLAIIPLLYLFLLLFQKDLAMMGDLGRHLKLGEIVVHCLCVPQTNLFSYTHADFPIVNHEWLAEVVFYLTSSLFGLDGLLILKMLLVITTASLLYRVALTKGSLFWVTIFSLLSLTIFSTRFNVLPELFSYLFIALFIFVIERYKESKKTALLWLLPFIELLWVNMHIYFIIGIGIYGLFLAETFFRKSKSIKQLLVICGVLIISLLLNPGFIHGALLPFTVFTNYGLTVEENMSPFAAFTASSTNTNIAYTLILQVLVFELLAALFLTAFFFKKQRKEILQTGVGLFAVGLGLKFMRCISVLGVLGFIPLVQTFTLLEQEIRKYIDTYMAHTIKVVIALGVGIIVLIHINGLFSYHILSFSFAPSSENAVNFIQKADIHGPIFNNYRIGNYLIYRLYPQEKIFVDARPEAYPASFFDDYWRMMSDEQFFNQQVKRYHINAIVFNVDDDPTKIQPFLLRLLNGNEWIPVYGDGMVTILVKNEEGNNAVIKKYKIVR